jgi:hypothetical protein
VFRFIQAANLRIVGVHDARRRALWRAGSALDRHLPLISHGISRNFGVAGAQTGTRKHRPGSGYETGLALSPELVFPNLYQELGYLWG